MSGTRLTHSISRDERGRCSVVFYVKGDGAIRMGREVQVGMGDMVIRGRIVSYSVDREYDHFSVTFSAVPKLTGRLIVHADIEGVVQVDPHLTTLTEGGKHP